jgi:CheY-like chemotaxis protein
MSVTPSSPPQSQDELCTTQHVPHVLVAEDDPPLRRLLTWTLRREGYLVEHVADGGRMLVRLAATYRDGEGLGIFDLIVSDLRMPISNGLAVLRALREAQWTAPFILITAYSDADTREIARAYDAIVLEKPVPLDIFRAAVAERLS